MIFQLNYNKHIQHRLSSNSQNMNENQQDYHESLSLMHKSDKQSILNK
jgi:hypothetical protein